MAQSDPTPSSQSRPSVESSRSSLLSLGYLRDNLRSLRVLLLISGAGASALGIIIWLFIRDLAGAGLLVLAVGAGLLLIDGVLSWRTVGVAVFGRRGRYGLNTLVIVAGAVAIAVGLNFLFFWLADRPDPMGWLRVDTTATKEFSLSDQSLAILENMDESVRANAFFTRDTARGAAAWRETEDLLNEFKRRSGGKFDYRLFDPELEPNVAQRYRVRSNPAIAFETVNSQRIEVLEGGANTSRSSPQVFNEQDISSSLLVVNQIEQKGVLFLTGHGERDITDRADDSDGYGRALQSIVRDNYAVASATTQEVGQLLAQGNPQALPAVLVVAGPQEELLGAQDTGINEEAILREYLRRGGNALFLLEPETPESWRNLLGRYGLTIGEHQVVDTSSFVAPNPGFLQVKRTNGQFPSDHRITSPLDVIYMPGSTFIGRTVNEQTVPLAEDDTPYLTQSILAVTTVSSWEETGEQISFQGDQDTPGPLPVGVAVEAISELDGRPERDEQGEWRNRNLVVIGDSDFASNSFFSSAKNDDLLANTVNWLAKDFELISTRPKVEVFRELVLTQNERDFIRWTGWLLMPALVGSVGVFSWWRRR